ncbi:MAG: hypothetical protein Q4A74_06350 [Cardiobacteriaceae bacterium]|nr:hypothetical protein [Cardiobacteriaceae bacterium]
MQHLFTTRRTTLLTLILVALLVLLCIAIFSCNSFSEWAFTRHHNLLSWYIRPLFLIPYCLFAWRRNLVALLITLLLLFSSMFWFPAPLHHNASVTYFLTMEQDWLCQAWGLRKVLSLLIIPLSLWFLAFICWQHRLYWGLMMLTIVAIGKIIWSLWHSHAGAIVILPALCGLGICIAALLVIARRR